MRPYDSSAKPYHLETQRQAEERCKQALSADQCNTGSEPAASCPSDPRYSPLARHLEVLLKMRHRQVHQISQLLIFLRNMSFLPYPVQQALLALLGAACADL